jgi:arylsulfatase A-like enzyme
MSRRLSSLVLLAFVLTVLACSPAPESSGEIPAAEEGNEIILVVLDGVGAADIGGYGGGGETPNLDRFAGDAVRFEWAFAQAPESTPSLASLLTGLYPTTHGVVEAGDSLAEEAETLAELVGASGFSTAAFLGGAPGANDFGLAQGFEVFESGGDVVAQAGAWLESVVSGDALLVLGLAPTPDVATADTAFGEALQSIGTAGGATIVVVSVAGASEGEGGAAGGSRLAPSAIRVPFLIRGAGFSGGTTVSEIVEVVDLMPTVLDLADVEVSAAVQGRSLVPLVEGSGQPPYIAFGESPFGGGEVYAALGGFYLVERLGGESEQTIGLYDLTTDPGGRTNLADGDERRVTVLRDHIDAWRKMTAASSLDPERRIEDLDEDTLEKLRSLGYVQ